MAGLEFNFFILADFLQVIRIIGKIEVNKHKTIFYCLALAKHCKYSVSLLAILTLHWHFAR